MKERVFIIVGVLLILVTVVMPLPPILGVSGIAWRAVIGLIGCILICVGIIKIKKKK